MEGNDYDSADDDVRVSITMTMSAGPANQRRYASSPALPKDGRMVLMTAVSPQMKQKGQRYSRTVTLGQGGQHLPTQAVGVLAALARTTSAAVPAKASKQHRPPAAGQVASSSAVAVAAEAAAGAPAAATEGVPVAPAVAAPPAAWGAP